jgi:ParB family chromosome partitioning protein
VRAVVKPLADEDHVIAQGQENAARSNLSFIERCLFAKRLADLGYDQTVIKSALALDATTLSKMQSVSAYVPESIILAIGSAKATGRDRWWQLSKLLQVPANSGKATSFIGSSEFATKTGDGRFNLLFDFLSRSKPALRKPDSLAVKSWSPKDKSVSVDIKDTGKAFTLALKARNASRFGAYITENLEELYEAFRQSETRTQTGD